VKNGSILRQIPVANVSSAAVLVGSVGYDDDDVSTAVEVGSKRFLKEDGWMRRGGKERKKKKRERDRLRFSPSLANGKMADASKETSQKEKKDRKASSDDFVISSLPSQPGDGFHEMQME
jgi:hypothetical protein